MVYTLCSLKQVKKKEAFLYIMSYITPSSPNPTFLSMSVSLKHSISKRSGEDNWEPEANGIFLLVCVEDKFDLHFNERPKLKNLLERHPKNWDKWTGIEQREAYGGRNTQMAKRLGGRLSIKFWGMGWCLLVLSLSCLLCQPLWE